MVITRKFTDPLSRKTVRIHKRAKNELLNSKSEFNHAPIARIIVEKNVREQGPQQPQKNFMKHNFNQTHA